MPPKKSAKKSGKKAAGDTPPPKKKNPPSYNSYIYKLLKDGNPNTGISKEGMRVVNEIVLNIQETLSLEAANASNYAKKKTLNAKDMDIAAKLVFPPGEGGLAEYAAAKAKASVVKYGASKSKASKSKA